MNPHSLEGVNRNLEFVIQNIDLKQKLQSFFLQEGNSLSLTELAAREVAASIPFEAVERVFPPVPEPLQLRIAFYSFPDMEEDIR